MSLGVIAASGVIGGGGAGYSGAILADSPLWYPRMDDAASIAAATSSSNFFSEPPSQAVDKNVGTYWTTNGTATGWLRLQLTSAQVKTGYSITRRDDIPARNAKDWTFEGSNDGTTWTTLDTRSGVTWPTTGEVKSFTFSNSTAYLYYRLNVTANNGDTYLSVAEIDMPGLICTDASGNSRHGYYTGGPQHGVASLLTGDANLATKFSAGSYGTSPSTTVWNVNFLSLSARIKTNAMGAYNNILYRDGASRVFIFRVNNANQIELVFWDSGAGLHFCTGATALVATTKYSVAATFDGANAKVFLNGLQDGITAYSGNLYTAAGSQPIIVGNGDLTIDEPAVFGYALPSTRPADYHAAA